MRIGLVEVGSSTIRYFVADFEPDMSFRPQKIETVGHGLHPLQPTQEGVAGVNAKVAAFMADAAGRDCEVLLAYGTAACRNAAVRFPGKLTPLLKVLTPAEEAMASWVAGLLCTPRSAGTTCTVIDQGSGSTEVVRAAWDGRAVQSLTFHSVEVGNVALGEAYGADAKGHLAHTLELVLGLKDAFEQAGLGPASKGDLFLVGGVATRIGWLASGRTGAQAYRPEAVNGVPVSRDGLIQLFKKLEQLQESNPAAARRLVDMREGGEQQVMRLLSCLPFLALLANHLDPRGKYFTSGYGVRHGMAFLLQRGLITAAPAQTDSMLTG